MKKLIALMTIAVLATSMVSSCGKAGNSSSGHKWQNSDTLNEWQIGLLESQGLPTDIEQLTPSQKRSIQHIYEMITYLNEKYDEEFAYSGYIEGGLMQEETLLAYPKKYGADGGRNTVEVTVGDNGDFTDNYSSIEVRDYCEKLYNDFIRDFFKSDEAVILINYFSSEIDSLSEIKDDDFEYKVGGTNIICISDKICDKEGIKEFMVSFAEFGIRHHIHSSNRIEVLHDVNISDLNITNCADYYDNSVLGSDISIYSDGTYATYSNIDLDNN